MDPKTLTADDNSNLLNKFPNLLLRLRINDIHLRNSQNGEMPFDLCCPSVRELLPARTCNLCGMYFASVKSVKSHKRICTNAHSALNEVFGQPILSQRLNSRPVRVAATRAQEKMIIWTSRLDDVHADWFGEEELVNVETDEINMEPEETLSIGPVIDLSRHMFIPWEDDA